MGTKGKKETRLGLWWAVGCGTWAVEQGQLRLLPVEEERALPSTGLWENLLQGEGRHEI